MIGDWESPTNFSPLFNGEVVAAQIDTALYAGLTRLDATLQWMPDLAVRVPTLENGGVRMTSRGMEVSYQLRQGLRWSDGKPISAQDVAFTWRVIVDPQTQGVLTTDGYRLISRFEVQDDRSFRLHFDGVYPEYLTLFPAVLPLHRLGDIPPARLASDSFWNRPDVVSGPYRIAELVPDEHITLARNEAWSAGRGGRRPHLDTIIYKVYPDAAALVAAARTGELDMALEIPESELKGLTSSGKLVAHYRPALAYEQVTLNQADPNPLTGKPPVWKDDPVLLQALRLAIDREGIVQSLLGGKAQLAQSAIPSALSPFHATDVRIRSDPERARQLLDSDGWRPGPDGIRNKAGRPLSFSFTTTLENPLRLQVRDRIIADWRKLGADVVARDAKPVDLFSGYAQGGMLSRGRFEAGLWTWSIGPDPDGVYATQHSSQIPTDANQGRGSNFGRFQSREIDRTLDLGRSSLKLKDRGAAYAGFERAYVQLAGELPLYERVLTVLASPRLHNLAPNPGPDTTLWNVADWWRDG